MKKIISFLSVLALFAASVSAQQATKLVVWLQDGTTAAYTLEEIRKVSLSASELMLHLEGTPYRVSTDRFQKITFAASATGIADVPSAASLSVYPNPVRERLFVKSDVAAGTPIGIFSADGRMCMQSVAGESGIDVRELAPGLYLLRIDNRVSKFRKL